MYLPMGRSLGIRRPPTRTRLSFLTSTPADCASTRTSRLRPSTTSTKTRLAGPPSLEPSRDSTCFGVTWTPSTSVPDAIFKIWFLVARAPVDIMYDLTTSDDGCATLWHHWPSVVTSSMPVVLTSSRPTVNSRGMSFPGYLRLKVSRHSSKRSSTSLPLSFAAPPPDRSERLLQRYPLGLLIRKYMCCLVISTPPSITLPSTWIVSWRRITGCWGWMTLKPFTCTRPAKIISSLALRLATPSCCSALLRRIPV
mmetsp:Transcript_39203/g.62796  ORF Transcript_39203/g.62796 Transcript_39203/m.62796 type:complete len:253 (-) Transcript_39203:248-1006(-)